MPHGIIGACVNQSRPSQVQMLLIRCACPSLTSTGPPCASTCTPALMLSICGGRLRYTRVLKASPVPTNTCAGQRHASAQQLCSLRQWQRSRCPHQCHKPEGGAYLERGVIQEETQPNRVAARHSDWAADFAARARQVDCDAVPVDCLRPGHLQRQPATSMHWRHQVARQGRQTWHRHDLTLRCVPRP